MKINTNIAFVSNTHFSASVKEIREQAVIVVTGEITKDCLTDFIMANFVAIAEVLNEQGLAKII